MRCLMMGFFDKLSPDAEFRHQDFLLLRHQTQRINLNPTLHYLKMQVLSPVPPAYISFFQYDSLYFNS